MHLGDDAAAEFSEVEVYRATEDIVAGTPGEDATATIETSTAIRKQVVFEGSLKKTTGKGITDLPVGVQFGTSGDDDPGGGFFGVINAFKP